MDLFNLSTVSFGSILAIILSNLLITDYTEAIGLKPDFADAYNARGLAKAEIGDKQGAIEDLQKAAQLFREQGNDDAYQVAQTKIREIQGISTEDEQVSRGNPQNVDAHLGRGIASYKREDYQTAIAEYNEAIRLAPQNAFAYNLRGNAYFAQENYQQAIKDYTQAIRLNPKFAVAYSNRGNIYYELEEYKSAVSDYSARPFVIDLCEPIVNKNILDLGCGEGYVGRELINRGGHC